MTAITGTFVSPRFPKRAKFVRLHIEFENEPDKMTADEFWDFCQENPQVRAELTKEGDVLIMPPTGFETSKRNSEITTQLRIWAKKDGTGISTDSNGGFILPNEATYAPGAAWTRSDRLEKFSAEDKQKFLLLCPDFVLELRSSSDNLKELQAKMEEYIENGARLGWLIDPKNKRIHIYRATGEIEILENADKISGEDILRNFELDLREIW